MTDIIRPDNSSKPEAEKPIGLQETLLELKSALNDWETALSLPAEAPEGPGSSKAQAKLVSQEEIKAKTHNLLIQLKNQLDELSL